MKFLKIDATGWGALSWNRKNPHRQRDFGPVFKHTRLTCLTMKRYKSAENVTPIEETARAKAMSPSKHQSKRYPCRGIVTCVFYQNLACEECMFESPLPVTKTRHNVPNIHA